MPRSIIVITRSLLPSSSVSTCRIAGNQRLKCPVLSSAFHRGKTENLNGASEEDFDVRVNGTLSRRWTFVENGPSLSRVATHCAGLLFITGLL